MGRKKTRYRNLATTEIVLKITPTLRCYPVTSDSNLYSFLVPNTQILLVEGLS